MENFSSLNTISVEMKEIYKPLILRLNNPSDKQTLESLISDGKVLYLHNEIYSQLEELIKSQHPAIKLKKTEYPELIKKHLVGREINEYGVWVYYPWNQRLIHLLDEEEFIEVRTNRNQYKITKKEQKNLRTKKIGIAGLSVGQSIAVTMAIESICGELRLADFDTVELSNLNRIRTGLHNLGLTKTIMTAREIAEIDPFMKVAIFNEGLYSGNMDNFFLNGAKLDLFVEVCDGIDVKINSRFQARELKIPVVMDTNDRGMLDIERFDIEPERSIFHGKLNTFIDNGSILVNDENRMQIIKSILSFETLSERMKESMAQIGKTINTWPQLASSVVLGGAITTDICRRILLDQHHESGRFYVDLDQIFNSN